MKKQAVNLNPFDAWQGLKENPLTGTAMQIGSLIPGASGVLGLGDALNNIYRGNYATAGMDAVRSVAGFLPGGQGTGLATRLASKGRLGNMASKIVPYIAPMSAEVSDPWHHIGNIIPQLTAQSIDQARMMNRPAYQKQMREHEAMTRDFNQWRRHKQTLQNMQPEPPVDQATQNMPPEAPVDQVKEGATPTYGHVAQNAWGVGKHVAPYMLATSMGGHMLPAYYNDDLSGMMRGGVVGGVGAAGGVGGMVGGSLVGASLGQLLSTVNPAMASQLMNGGAVAGGTIGTLLGHRAGRRLAEHFVEDEQPQTSHRFNKWSSAPAFNVDPVGYAGHQAGRVGGAVGRGVNWMGDKATHLGDARTGQILGQVAQHIGRHPVGYGTAAVGIPSLLAMRYMMSGKSKPAITEAPEEKTASGKSQRHERGQQAKRTSQLLGANVNPNDPSAIQAALNKGRRRGRSTVGPGATLPVEAPMQLPPVMDSTVLSPSLAMAPREVAGGLNPAATMVDPSHGAFSPMLSGPTWGESIGRHPMMSFAGRNKIPLAVGGTALAAGGAYLWGRHKRKKEDQAAEEAMAQAE